MPKIEDQYDSFYDHICSIAPKTDVLESDIIGNSFKIRMRRKFYDLFLLSYEDSRTRDHYSSSHVMRMERLKQYRLYKYRIHPFSKFRNFWDFLMVHIFLCNKIFQHHNTSAILSQYVIGAFYIGILLEIIIIFDLFVNMNTAFIDNESKEITFDFKKGLTNYFSKKLFIHSASAIPIQTLVFLKYGKNVRCSMCKANFYMCVLRYISIISLYRVWETTMYCIRNKNGFGASHINTFIRIILIGFFSLLQVINFGDTVSLSHILISNYVNPASHFSYLLRMAYNSKFTISNYKKIAYEYVRVCKSLVLFSVSPVQNTYYLDLILSLVAYMVANVIYVWCLLECYNYFCCSKYSQDHVMINKKSTSDLLISRKLPDDVYEKMMDYYYFDLSKMTVIKRQNCLISGLPDVLQREIMLGSYRNYVLNVPYFSEWPANVIDDITSMLKEEIYLANDIVVEPWLQDGLIIVDAGELATYTNDDEELAHLIDGDYFGEVSLITDKDIQSTFVIAITDSQILKLDKEDFRIYMTKYPDLFFALKKILKKDIVESDSANHVKPETEE